MIMCFMSSTNLRQCSAPASTLEHAIQNASYNIRYFGLRADFGNWSWSVDKLFGG